MNNYFRAYERLTIESFSVARKIIKYQRGILFYSIFPLITSVIILFIGMIQLTSLYSSFFSELVKILLALLILFFSALAIGVDLWNRKNKDQEKAISVLRQILNDLEKHHRSLSEGKEDFNFYDFYNKMDMIRKSLDKLNVELSEFPFSFRLENALKEKSEFYWIFICQKEKEYHERKLEHEAK